MNKKNYINILREQLNGKISKEELEDIISDYEGFFASGIEEGKTEEDISFDLGSPKEIAETLTEGALGKITLPYAKVMNRVCAIIIDIIIAGLPFMWFAPVASIGAYFMPQVILSMVPSLLSTVKISSHTWISNIKNFWTIMIILSTIWFFFINVISLILLKGQTLGKKIMHIRVVASDGTKASILQILLREIIGKYFINFLGALLPGVLVLSPSIASLIWCFYAKEHDTIHDKLAGTCVVECKD